MNTKKFIAILLCLVAVLTITAACSKDKNEDVTVYQTDLWGETVTNEKGENVTIPVEGTSIEYVTDKNGNKLLDDKTELSFCGYILTGSHLPYTRTFSENDRMNSRQSPPASHNPVPLSDAPLYNSLLY